MSGGLLDKMVKCVFCGAESDAYRGTHLIKNDGSINYYCSSKCRNNSLKLKRDKKRVKWTEAYRIELEKTKKKSEKKTADEAIKTAQNSGNPVSSDSELSDKTIQKKGNSVNRIVSKKKQ